MIDPLDLLFVMVTGSTAIASVATATVAYLSFAPRCRYRKVGGLRFVRVGRLQLSFCICKGN